MGIHTEETVFISFICPVCHQEIEAPAEMADEETECPTCAALITVPAVSAPGTLWGAPFAPAAGPSQAQLDAMKSRTIRIELDDTW